MCIRPRHLGQGRGSHQLYSLAFSQPTGLRLYDLRCAWFDENGYFEFFPLHLVYESKTQKPEPKTGTRAQAKAMDPESTISGALEWRASAHMLI